jgi:hypothetical protein
MRPGTHAPTGRAGLPLRLGRPTRDPMGVGGLSMVWRKMASSPPNSPRKRICGKTKIKRFRAESG